METVPVGKLKLVPTDWEDDMKMTVMFAPFRDKNLNPRAWEQKMKFWMETIVEESKQSKEAFVDVLSLREKFLRNGKSPSCFEMVLQEMEKKGLVRQLSDINNETATGWLSWGYEKLVKQPVGWSLKWFSGKQETKLNQSPEKYIVVDVIKQNGAELIELRQRLHQAEKSGIVEYTILRNQHREMCASDLEFDLIMRHLESTSQIVIQLDENNSKLVKFIEKESVSSSIDEQDLHIHRIQKAHGELKNKIEILLKEVKRLAAEAISYKQNGMNKLAISCMRKRKLALARVDKLTGSMDTLDDILHRIKEAESNEMIIKAIAGGTSVLQGLHSRIGVDDVTSVMDNLADVTQTQDDIMAELNTSTFVDESSQEELEDELSIILREDMPSRKQATHPGMIDSAFKGAHEGADEWDLHRELEEILNESSEGITDLDKMLDDLKLPDVPQSSPGRIPGKQLLTS